jgi:hypothetical protein
MTTLASAIKTKYEKEMLPLIRGQEAFSKFASKSKMTKMDGDTVRWNKVRRLAKQTTFNLTDGQVTNASPKALNTDYLEATVGVVGDSLEGTKGVKLTAILKDDTYMDAVVDQILRTKEYLGQKQIAQYCLRHRVDNDSTYEVSGTCDSGTVSTLVDDALTQADDFWGTDASNPGFVCGTGPEGVNYDIASLVTDFVASSDTATVDFKQACGSTMKYHMVIGTGIVAGDKMTSTAISRVAGKHQLLMTKKFKGNTLYGFMHPAQLADMYTDATFVDIMKYSKPGLFANYETYRVFGVEFIILNELYREDDDGSENESTGVVYVSPIFGKDAYNVSKWTNGKDGFGIEVDVITKPDSGNPWGLKWWINWHGYAAVATQRATSIIGLMAGATDMGLTV